MTAMVEGLNPAQLEAVLHDDGPALVLAGAGSGKTRVITSRVVRLISSGVSPHSLLCVTFTNKAAGEMRERISAMLGINSYDMWIATFHSACLRIIKAEYTHLGYPSMPAVFDSGDQKALIKGIIKGMGLADADLPHRKVQAMISRFKNQNKGPEHMVAELKSGDAREMAEVFKLYQEALFKNNAMDFDDLLLGVIRLWESCPDVLADYRQRFKYLLVDEFQDTNTVQYKIVKLLVGRTGNLFAVGDDDQSIYRWRGAQVDNILNFEKDFDSCKVVKLEENYRSTGNILRAAGEVVKSVYGRNEKTLWTKKSEGEKITLYTANDEQDEANYLAGAMLGQVQRGESTYGDMAVFYRTNAQSRVIEESLNRFNIPYRIFGGRKFYDRKEVKDAMAYFRIALNPYDTVSFFRAIAAPSRGVGGMTIAKLMGYAEEKGATLVTVCADDNNPASKAVKARLKEFASLIEYIREQAESAPAGEVIEEVLDRSGVLDALREKRTAQDDARVENLKELASAPHDGENLMQFIERISLVADSDSIEADADYVSLMTIHVAKGLEYPTVFIVGMEDNLFPHFNSVSSIEEMDEERRLFYVAITRAMKKVFLTHAKVRRIYGQVSVNPPSPFLADIPEEILDKQKSTIVPYSASNSGYGNSYSGYSKPVKPKQQPLVVNDIASSSPFSQGKMVKHAIFGNGVIKKAEGAGDDKTLTILFSHAGTKKLKSRFVEAV